MNAVSQGLENNIVKVSNLWKTAPCNFQSLETFSVRPREENADEDKT